MIGKWPCCLLVVLAAFVGADAEDDQPDSSLDGIFSSEVVAESQIDSARIEHTKRGDLEVGLTAGLAVPFSGDYAPGPYVHARIQGTMAQATNINFGLEFKQYASDVETSGDVTSFGARVGVRGYPAYQRFAGHRGIEPLWGAFVAGGYVSADSINADNEVDGQSAFAGSAGIELGLRVKVGGMTFAEILVQPTFGFLAGDVAELESMSDVQFGLAVFYEVDR